VFSNVNPDFNEDLWDGNMRSLVIGFSSADNTDPGESFCIMVPMAIMRNDPEKRNTGKGHLRTGFEFGAGYYAGDIDNAVLPLTTPTANSLFRLGMGAAF
jgi:hypothetical protein